MRALTGFKCIDRKMKGGLKPGYIYVIAGRPGMGRTSLALNMLANMCIAQSKTALMFSCEMSRRQIVDRLISLEGNVDRSRIYEGQLNRKEWEGISKASDILKDANVIIDDNPETNVDYIRKKCMEYKSEYRDLAAVFIDNIHLVNVSKRYASRRQKALGLMKEIKTVVRDVDIPFVIISQLSRSPEWREDHRPCIEDLEEMGICEEDTDVIMLIYRDDYYSADSEDTGIAEITIAQNRGGTRGMCKLGFVPEVGLYNEIG